MHSDDVFESDIFSKYKIPFRILIIKFGFQTSFDHKNYHLIYLKNDFNS